MTDKSLALNTDAALIPSTSEWSLMRDMAKSLLPTGFLPESIKTAEQAVAIMLKGRELRVPPMYALSNIAVVKGKPTISAEMMLALIYRDHGKRAIRVKDSTDTSCTVEYRLEGWSDVLAYTFTIEQAKAAGLTRNSTWSQYPAAMLRARCISAVARMAFPESIGGMYVPGELGEAVTVTDDGEVVSLSTGEITPTARTSVDTEYAITETRNEEQEAVTAEQALRGLHAAAKDLWPDLPAMDRHQMLHQWAVTTLKLDSLADVPAETMTGLAAMLKGSAIKAAAFRSKYAPVEVIEAAPDGAAEQYDLINDPELNAAADRVQAAEKARR